MAQSPPSKNAANVPFLGFGLGLRTPHYAEISEHAVGVDWFEAISENFMRPGGNPRRVLREIRERFALVLHGVSMSIGSVDPLNQEYLKTLAVLANEFEPAWVSDHLCWSGTEGKFAHDLLPLPYTEEALAHVSARIAQVQDKLKRPMVIENVSSYMAFSQSTMTEWDFLAKLSQQSGCLLLLDVNNIFVSAHNHSFNALDFVNGIPLDKVAQIHVAGHRKRGELLLDTHDHAVPEGVWDVYKAAIQRFGPVSTLVEWDAQIPPLHEVIAQANRAKEIAESLCGPLPVSNGERGRHD